MVLLISMVLVTTSAFADYSSLEGLNYSKVTSLSKEVTLDVLKPLIGKTPAQAKAVLEQCNIADIITYTVPDAKGLEDLLQWKITLNGNTFDYKLYFEKGVCIGYGSCASGINLSDAEFEGVYTNAQNTASMIRKLPNYHDDTYWINPENTDDGSADNTLRYSATYNGMSITYEMTITENEFATYTSDDWCYMANTTYWVKGKQKIGVGTSYTPQDYKDDRTFTESESEYQ